MGDVNTGKETNITKVGTYSVCLPILCCGAYAAYASIIIDTLPFNPFPFSTVSSSSL